MKIQQQPDYLIFAEDAKTGEVQDFPNILRGWGVTIDQTQSKPPMEWMNGAFNRVDKNIQYLLQQGVPEWNNQVLYPVGAVIKYKNILYIAKLENDNATPSTSTTKWEKLVKDATTAVAGTVKLNSAVNSSSEIEAATPKAVKAAYDLASGALPKTGGTVAGDLSLSGSRRVISFKDGNHSIIGAADFAISLNGSDDVQKPRLWWKKSDNKWVFENTADVTINGKSVLKQGDAVPFSGLIPASTDLNTLIGDKNGVYYQTYSANASTSLNYPVNNIAGALVIYSLNGQDSCVQKYYPHGTTEEYVRTYNQITLLWTEWVKLITTANIASYQSGLGVGQTWQDVKSSRSAGVTYTNTTGKPILVNITTGTDGGGWVYLYVNDVTVASYFYTDRYGNSSVLSAVVPNNSTYKLSSGGINFWSELR